MTWLRCEQCGGRYVNRGGHLEECPGTPPRGSTVGIPEKDWPAMVEALETGAPHPIADLLEGVGVAVVKEIADESCDCPPGAWHLRTCTAVYWPPHMRDDGDEAA